MDTRRTGPMVDMSELLSATDSSIGLPTRRRSGRHLLAELARVTHSLVMRDLDFGEKNLRFPTDSRQVSVAFS
jgi:hypothetical protein